MRYTILMLLGIFIGARWLPEKYRRWNGTLQIIITIVLLFTMGVSLGAQPDFFANLRAMGLVSLLYAAGGVAFSVAFVWLLAKLFLRKEEEKE